MRLFQASVIALFAVSSTLPIAGLAQSGDAGALLSKHAAFTGFVGGATQATWQATGTRTGDRGASDRFDEARSGLVYRDTISTPQNVSDSVGYSGRAVWHADANGFTAAVMGAPRQAAIDFDIVRSETLAALGTTAITGSADVGGTACTIVRATPNGGTPMDLYVDPRSGAFLRVVVDPTGTPTTFDGLQYGAAGAGKRAIDAWTVDGHTYALTSIDAKPTVPDTLLAPPPQTATWTFSSQTSPVIYATENDNNRQVKVTASVNGRTGVFLLDTTTPSILLYEPFAGQAGVTNMGSSDFSPYVGNIQYGGYARAATVAIGSNVLHNVIVETMYSRNAQIAGILGYDFLAGAIVNVDLKQRTLQLLDPSIYAAQTAPGGYAFPVDLTDRTPSIAMRLPRGGAAFPSLDTGLSGFLLLSQGLSDRREIEGIPIEDTSTIGFGGQGASSDPIATTGTTITYTAWNSASTSGSCITVKQMQIGPYTYTNPEACFGGTNVFGQDRGLIGMDFLRHFNWTIDYPDASFVVNPNGE
ncbi:MAG TPA: retropepsin-like aspartic protease [Candidatus Baltobacteraceae bacterium]